METFAEFDPRPTTAPEPIEFKDFGKIGRFRTVTALITEKIDGTNAQIYVPPCPTDPVLAGSRNRWITPERDNFGFARFIYENAELFRMLGPGRHYGEWWGCGIQRVYGQTVKRFSLFDVQRYSGSRFPDGIPAPLAEKLGSQIGIVPVLYHGPVDTAVIDATIAKLYAEGSVVVPGWSKPEGVIIQIAGSRWKVTDNGDAHKGAVQP